MKIGVLSNLYPPHAIGGYERLCAEVCGELVSLGHEVAVLTSDYGGSADQAPAGQTVTRAFLLLADYENIYRPRSLSNEDREGINRSNVEQLNIFIDRHRPDVLFVWNMFFLDADLLKEARLLGVPVVFFLTDNWLIAQERGDRIGGFFERFVHGRQHFGPESLEEAWPADAIRPEHAIFGSRFVQQLHRFCGFRFDGETVIHNGVRVPMVPDDMMVDRSSLRTAAGAKLLFAGRVVDVKGLHLVIEAMPAILRNAPTGNSVTLNVVGDTQDVGYFGRIKARISELGLDSNVQFLAPVSETNLMSLFNDHDVFLFSSIYEPFSLTLIHALGAGIPTVATAIGGNTEIVVDGETGLLFDRLSPDELSSAVCRFLTDPELRLGTARSGRRVAGRFTFRRMITRIEHKLVELSSTAKIRA